MGLFGFGSSPTPSLPAKERLQGHVKLAEKVIDNKGLFAQTARVALVLDISGSMDSLYRNGLVQTLCERALPLGIKFDDNKAIDVFLFSDGSRHRDLGELTEGNFDGYVDNVILKKHNDLWGGTEYAPVMNSIIDKYTKTKGAPAYIMFVTDGDNSDHSAAEKAIRRASEFGIFWQFIGIGNASFSFLQKLDTMSGRVIDNANFFQANDIKNMSDDELYSKMLAEFPQWLKEAAIKSII